MTTFTWLLFEPANQNVRTVKSENVNLSNLQITPMRVQNSFEHIASRLVFKVITNMSDLLVYVNESISSSVIIKNFDITLKTFHHDTLDEQVCDVLPPH